MKAETFWPIRDVSVTLMNSHSDIWSDGSVRKEEGGGRRSCVVLRQILERPQCVLVVCLWTTQSPNLHGEKTPEEEGRKKTWINTHLVSTTHNQQGEESHNHTVTNTQSHKHTNSHKHTITQTHSHTNTQSHNHTNTVTNSHTNSHTNTQSHKHTVTQTVTQSHKVTNTQSHKHSHKQSHKQSHKHTVTQTHSHTNSHTKSQTRSHTNTVKQSNSHTNSHTRSHTNSHTNTVTHQHTITLTHSHTHVKRLHSLVLLCSKGWSEDSGSQSDACSRFTASANRECRFYLETQSVRRSGPHEAAGRWASEPRGNGHQALSPATNTLLLPPPHLLLLPPPYLLLVYLTHYGSLSVTVSAPCV